jgi:RimJ/RimL family protein N-acetyltransferase
MAQITFKEFSLEDVPQYYKWAEKPHVKEIWFKEGYQPKESIIKKISGNGIDYPFVILVDDKPIGHIQFWDIYARDQLEINDQDYFTGEPEGTYGIDIFIGEDDYLGKGYGTQIIIAFTKLLFEKYHAKKIVIDPDADNIRAIRCYEKAGFRFLRFAECKVDGKTMIMEYANT